MNMFEEIEKLKKDLPRFKTIERKVIKYKLNGYQKFAVVTYLLSILFGIILGNLFPVCSSSATLYSTTCSSLEFNSFLMICVWFGSLFVCILFFAIGHIIELLSSINNKLK